MPATPVLLPILALLLAATFWGLIWWPLRALEQAGLTGAWQALASYAAGLVVLAPLAWRHRAELRHHGRALWLLALAAGWTNVAFILAVLDGTVVRVLLLFYLSPVWSALLGRIFLQEPLTARTAATLSLGLAGTLLMLWDPTAGMLAGFGVADWLALSSGLAFAATNVATRHLQGVSLWSRTWMTQLGVVGVAGLAILWLGQAPPAVGPEAWSGAAALGLVGFLFITLAVVYGVSHMPIQRSAVIMLFEILVGALSAWVLAGEALTLSEWLGGALILAAGLVAIRPAGRGAE